MNIDIVKSHQLWKIESSHYHNVLISCVQAYSKETDYSIMGQRWTEIGNPNNSFSRPSFHTSQALNRHFRFFYRKKIAAVHIWSFVLVNLIVVPYHRNTKELEKINFYFYSFSCSHCSKNFLSHFMENVSATKQQKSNGKKMRKLKGEEKEKDSSPLSEKLYPPIHSMFLLHLHLHAVFSLLFISIGNNIGFSFVLRYGVSEMKMEILHETRERNNSDAENNKYTSSTCIARFSASTTRHFRIC